MNLTATDVGRSCRAMHSAGLVTLTQAVALLEIVRVQSLGEPHTLTTLSETLDMPVSTLSRVVWDLVQLELVEQKPHAIDRRRKVLTADLRRVRKVLR